MTFHPTLNERREMVKKLHTTLGASDEPGTNLDKILNELLMTD